ncbi:hypothetical protein M2322_002776 [Rhodoblastus acidophilus]|uniref:HGGxSTG domain-containing protein n=1 Tax=Rhodoblastus acidophilus TaxID=1074 RepID=UPI002225A407|nr:HGGxSTG domain-containing protein [Rhodoblastus acidophilus]MCW2317222.1 hypothetical protein [Rhodoblastus acidophilus]
MKSKRPLSPLQIKWRTSTAFRAIALAAMRKAHERRRELPKCGAARKRDGEPCQNLALENGRCKFHGGKTPKGADWHKPQFGAGDSTGPDVATRIDRKTRDLEKRRAKRARRLAAMTKEERAAHDAWHAAHKPGAGGERQRARNDREVASWLADLLARKDDYLNAGNPEELFP